MPWLRPTVRPGVDPSRGAVAQRVDVEPSSTACRSDRPVLQWRRGGRPGSQNAQRWQSTATARAAQTCSIRRSLRRPSRSTRTPVDTLSTESRLMADRRGTGSSPGSRTTSLGRSRMVVVQGPISVRRSRGIAASRERTTTGRRPMSGSSHHQTSPRAGTGVTTQQLRHGTTRGLPTRLLR